MRALPRGIDGGRRSVHLRVRVHLLRRLLECDATRLPQLRWRTGSKAPAQTAAGAAVRTGGRVAGAARVVVATDDDRIARALADSDVDVCMTRPDHASGSDRLAECAAREG